MKLGRIRCATIVSRDTDACAAAYVQALNYRVVERGAISTQLASAWHAKNVAGARFVTLGPVSGANTVLRFVERADAVAYRPFSCLGWNAIEFAVQSCDQAAERLAGCGFAMVGAPQDLGFSAGALRAAQLQGPCGEVLYLTEIKRPLAGFDLPVARCSIDHVFIAVLTSNATDAAFGHYAEQYENAAGGAFETAVPVIARYQHMHETHVYRIGTLPLADQCYIEIDDAPSKIGPRLQQDGYLPDGIAMISFDISAGQTPADSQNSLVRPGGKLYRSHGMICTRGAVGELLELLEQ